jgi:hypothetical protein
MYKQKPNEKEVMPSMFAINHPFQWSSIFQIYIITHMNRKAKKKENMCRSKKIINDVDYEHNSYTFQNRTHLFWSPHFVIIQY